MQVRPSPCPQSALTVPVCKRQIRKMADAQPQPRRRGRAHGLTKSREYRAWVHMRTRCNNPKHRAYPYYGGRGITVCERWMNSFVVFLADMGPCPPGHWLDRKESNLNYSPENCKWSTPQEQQNNRRDNILLTFQGRTQSEAMWERELGFRPKTINNRRRHGWPTERAIATPVRPTSSVRP